MNIVYVCNEYPPVPHGGIGVVVKLLAEDLVRRGHRVHVVGTYQVKSVLFENANGVKVVRLPKSKIPNLGWILNRITIWWYLRNLHEREEINVVECTDFGGYMPIRPNSMISVLRLEGSRLFFDKAAGERTPNPLAILERLTLRSNSDWIAPSKYVLEKTKEITQIQPRSYRIIGNPVDMSLHNREYIGANSNMILFVGGSLAVKKGVLQLAKAADRFLSVMPNMELFFLGREVIYHGSPISQIILDNVGDQVRDRVKFQDPVPHAEVISWICNARVCVMPSFMETFGNVWAEAMACGCPVIGSILGPGPEVVEDGVSGLLANPYDPRDIADKVLTILRDPGLAARFGVNGRQKVRAEFELTKISEKTLAFYRDLLFKR